MKILVGCEESGTVVDRLIAAGYDAWSCDLEPTRGNNPKRHIEANILQTVALYWDAMICFYPCTYMANSGAKHLYNGMKKENGINKERWGKMENAARIFKYLLNCKIPKIAMENPVMLGHAKKLIGRKQDQIIQPWQYGHGEQKQTCLWLKGFPLLKPTNIVSGREQKVWRMGPSDTRQRDRSVTYPGIADAMVSQWFNQPDVQGEKNDTR